MIVSIGLNLHGGALLATVRANERRLIPCPDVYEIALRWAVRNAFFPWPDAHDKIWEWPFSCPPSFRP